MWMSWQCSALFSVRRWICRHSIEENGFVLLGFVITSRFVLLLFKWNCFVTIDCYQQGCHQEWQRKRIIFIFTISNVVEMPWLTSTNKLVAINCLICTVTALYSACIVTFQPLTWASAGCPVPVVRRSARLGALLHQPVPSLDNRSHEVVGRVLPPGGKRSCSVKMCSD